MKNINELRAFTNDQLDDPVTRTIAADQLGRLRKIAADHNANQAAHNANPNKKAGKAGYGDRITTMLQTRGAHAGTQNNSVYSLLHRDRDGNPVPVSHNTAFDSKEIPQDARFSASKYGAEKRKARRKLDGRRREYARGVAAAKEGGFTKPDGISEENNMNIKQYYKQILNSQLNEGRRPKPMVKVKKVKDASPDNKNIRNETARIKRDGQRDRGSAMNEATPAEIQAHQISRLDRIGNKFNGGAYGADLSKPRNLRAGKRIANLYNKAGVLGGFRPYSGLAGSDPVMLRLDTWPAYPKAIANANAELKRDRGSNRTVGQKIRGFIKRTTGLEEMNQVDEMALTKNAFNKMLTGVKQARAMGDATSGVKSALHWRDYEKQSNDLVNALKSPRLYDIGPKGGLVQIDRLKGSRDPTGIITAAGNLRTKVPKPVLRSAKKLAKLHGMFYTTHGLGDEDVRNPVGHTVAVGGKLGPTSGFIRQSRKVSKGFDQIQMT